MNEQEQEHEALVQQIAEALRGEYDDTPTPTAGGKVDTAPEAGRDYYWPGTFGPADPAPESGEGR